MARRIPPAAAPVSVPVAVGTTVQLDEAVRFYSPSLVAGGSPWRLLRLPGASATALARWRDGSDVRAGQGALARTLVNHGVVHPRFEGPADLDDVEIVVPVRDEPAIESLLVSLSGLRVTVVDDGSLEPVASRDDVRVISLATNRGPAAARNAGADATTAPFIWFIDGDVVIEDALRVGRVLRAHFNDPLVAAASARIVGQWGDGVRDRFESRCGPLDLGPSDALVAPLGRVSYVPAACLMVRREAFGGGFDESLRVGEDVDLVWRMGDAGWLVRHEASAVVQHPARSSWSAWWRQREGYGRSAAALKVRHPDKVDALRVDLWTLSTWLAVASGRPRAALGVLAAARRSLLTQLPERVEDAGRVATEIVARGVLRAPGPLARSSVRSYAPLLVLGAMLAKTRRPVILVLALGTAWRWRRHGVPRPVDALVGVADDLAYATGVWRGALEVRSGAVLVPRVTGSTSSLRAALARSTTKPPPPEMDDGGSRY